MGNHVEQTAKEEETIPPLFSKEQLHQYIKESIIKTSPNKPKEEKQKEARLMLKIFEEGQMPGDAMGISIKERAILYKYAHTQFSSGKYLEAREAFKLLLFFEPDQPSFATSLGVCHHRLQQYDLALACYMLAASLDPSDPVPFFYAYDCFVHKNDQAAAGIMLCSSIKRAGDVPQYAALKQRAEGMVAALESHLASNPSA